MEKKITLKENFERLAKVIAEANIEEATKKELLVFIDGRIEQINKKATAPRKADTEKAQENEKLAQAMIDVLASSEIPMTITEIMQSNTIFDGVTNQKLTAIMTKLKNDGTVARVVDKKNAKYIIVK